MNEKEKKANLIREANSLIKEVNKMPNSNERIKLIYKIDSLLSFMYYGEFIKIHEYQMLWKKITKNIDNRYKRQNEIFSNIYTSNKNLLQIYSSVLDLYSVNKIKYNDTSVNSDSMDKALINFLDKIDVLNLFNDIRKEDMFIKGSSNIESGMCIDNYDLSYIILGRLKKDKIEYYTTLIHELGHAYVNRLLNEKQKGYYEFEIYREIIPHLFVRMFYDFLEKNNIIKKDKLQEMISNNEMIGYYNLYLAKRICEIISNSDINHMTYLKYAKEISFDKELSPFIHHTALAHIASSKLFLNYKDNEEEFINDLSYIIKRFPELNYNEFLNEFIDINTFRKCLNGGYKEKQKKKELFDKRGNY